MPLPLDESPRDRIPIRSFGISARFGVEYYPSRAESYEGFCFLRLSWDHSA